MPYNLRSAISASDVANYLGLQLVGENRVIRSVSTLDEAESDSFAFSKSAMSKLVPGVFVAPPGTPISSEISLIESPSPRVDFARALAWLESSIGFSHHSHAPRISPHATIGSNVVVEDGCVVEAGAFIEDHVVLKSGTRVGAGARVQSGACIGSDGFGFVRVAPGAVLRFPHLAGVQLGARTDIGPNTTVARGTLHDTILESDVKISSLVGISHNCFIGRGTMIAVGASLSGGTVVGEDCWIGSRVVTRHKVRIGDRAFVGVGAVVVKDVPSETVCAGNPAQVLRHGSALNEMG